MNPQNHLNEESSCAAKEVAQDSLDNFYDELFRETDKPRNKNEPADQNDVLPVEEGPKEQNTQEKRSSLMVETKGAWTVSTDTNTNLRIIVLQKEDGSKIEIEDLNGKAKIRIHKPFLKEDLVMTDLKAYGFSADGSFSVKNDEKLLYNNSDGSLTCATSLSIIRRKEETYQLDGRMSTEELDYFDMGDKDRKVEKGIRNTVEIRGEWVVYKDKDKDVTTSVLRKDDGTQITAEEVDKQFRVTIHAPFLKKDIILNNQNSFSNNWQNEFYSSSGQNSEYTFKRSDDGELSSETTYGLRVLWKTDGTKITNRPYGTVITEKPDGSTVSELFTGHKITHKADGSYAIEIPDHKIINWTAKNNGVTKEANSPEIISLPDGLKISHLKNGTDVYEWPDGRKVTEFDDGRLQRITPYSLLIGDKGNDKSRRGISYANAGYLIEQDGLKPEDNILQDSEEAKIVARKLEKELEVEFGVTFSKLTDPPHVIEINGSKKARPCRQATLQELLVIREALYKSQPNNNVNGRGVRFEFLDGERFGSLQAFYENGTIHIPTRFISDKLDWFQNDKIAYNGKFDTASFEAIVMHELAHNKTQRINPFKGNNYYSESQLASYFGLKQIRSLNNVPVWVILAKKKSDGVNHDMYALTKSGDGRFEAYRCNSHTLREGDEENISLEELCKRALVNSATFHLESPEEIITEALVCLRIGGKTRAEAMIKSPQAMAKAQELDQDEIDYAYAPNQMYPYGLNRSSDGYLVAKSFVTIHNRTFIKNGACQK